MFASGIIQGHQRLPAPPMGLGLLEHEPDVAAIDGLLPPG